MDPLDPEKNPFDEHLTCPRRAGVLSDPDAKIRVEGDRCGDLIDLYVQWGPSGEVADCRYQVYGCAASIVCGSILADWLVGRTRAECAALDVEELSSRAGGLDDDSVHAAELVCGALEELAQVWPESRGSGSELV